MIETHMQQQQQDTISQQSSHPHPHADPETQMGAGTSPAITCSVCDAMYAPSPQQAPFLQYAQGTLEAAFMAMCHFCFRCRRAACPQCWDEVHGVCGSCVQEAGLPFRAGATPLAGLIFPPTGQASFAPTQPQNNSLLVLLGNGRFYRETEVKPEPGLTDTTTEHTSAVESAVSQPETPDTRQDDTGIPADTVVTETSENRVTDEGQVDIPAAAAIPTKTPAPEYSQEARRQKKTPRATKAKQTKKASRLELVLTWIVLVIVVALVVIIALAEFIPAVNVAIVHVTHIDIRGEITYLVHIVQQLFKR